MCGICMGVCVHVRACVSTQTHLYICQKGMSSILCHSSLSPSVSLSEPKAMLPVSKAQQSSCSPLATQHVSLHLV